jgi:parvulin-like peptidyl-prolyl isomerase
MKTKMKSKTLITASLLALLLIFGAGAALMGCSRGGADGNEGGGAQDESAVAATVGGIEITENAVNTFTELMFIMYGVDFSTVSDAEKPQYLAETLDTMVKAAAMELYFEGKDIFPDDAEDSFKQLTDMIDQTEGMKERFDSKGITEDTLRYYTNTQYYFQALAEEATENGTLPTEADIEAYYAEHEQEFPEERRVSHILVGDAEHKDEDRKLVEEIREKIASGEESFEDMALEYGQDDTKNRGGDLDYAVRDAYVPEFSDVAFTLPKDELSGIVESQFGFHILKVTDIRPASLDAQRESIRSTLSYEISDNRAKELVEEYDVVYPT